MRDKHTPTRQNRAMNHAPPPLPPAPETVGPYRVFERLGRGGVADVFLGARQLGASFGPYVAIKRMHTGGLDHPMMVDGFTNEMELLSLFEHPNVLQGLDRGLDGPLPYLVTEFVDGQNLAALNKQTHSIGRQLPIPVAVHIAVETLKGVAYVHRFRGQGGRHLQLVHSDVAPDNILVGYDGSVRLADFGVARPLGTDPYADTDPLVGKLSYLAPELIRGERFDQRVDIYAMGVLLYELIAGRPPVDALNMTDDAAMARILDGQVPRLKAHRPDVPLALERIVHRAMHPQAKNRYTLAEEMAVELGGIAGRMRIKEALLGRAVRRLFASQFKETAHRR